MPADNTLPDITPRHSDAGKPWPCSKQATIGVAPWAIKHGYCRNSLDMKEGHKDPRCPVDCRHRAPLMVAMDFDARSAEHGVQAAAAVTLALREMRDGWDG